MPIVQDTATGVVVIPTAGPPGISIKGDKGDQGLPGERGERGEQGSIGPAGEGSLVSRKATADIADWTAVIADGPGGCRPADPFDPAQRQQVIAIVARGAAANAVVQGQNAGDLLGPNAGFVPGTTMFVGPGGALTSTPPTSGWLQAVASVIADGHIVVNLSEARVIDNDGQGIISLDGSFVRATDYSRDLIQGASDQSGARDFLGIGSTGTLPIANVAVSNSVQHATGARARFGQQVDLVSTLDPVSGVGRLDVRRTADSNDTFADIYLYGDTRNAGPGTSGNVSTMLKIEQFVGSASGFQWPLVATVHLYGGGAGQHVAVTPQAIKHAEAGSTASSLWAQVCELRDYTSSPQSGSVSQEIGLHVAGPDPNGRRIALDLSLGEANDPGVSPQNESAAGISVANTSGFHNHRTAKGITVNALWRDTAYEAYSRESVAQTSGAYKRYFRGGTIIDANLADILIQERRFTAGSGQMGTASEFVRLVDGAEQNRMSFFSDHTEFTKPVSLELPRYTIATLPNPGLFTARPVYVSDGSSGRRIAISAGTSWVYGDGAIVS